MRFWEGERVGSAQPKLESQARHGEVRLPRHERPGHPRISPGGVSGKVSGSGLRSRSSNHKSAMEKHASRAMTRGTSSSFSQTRFWEGERVRSAQPTASLWRRTEPSRMLPGAFLGRCGLSKLRSRISNHKLAMNARDFLEFLSKAFRGKRNTSTSFSLQKRAVRKPANRRSLALPSLSFPTATLSVMAEQRVL